MSYYDDYMKKTKKAREEEIAVITDTTAKQKNSITENYNANIKEAETAYDNKYRVNAVQKLINERQIAESMANSGLTNSGLNRTQQTAVQLSYANNKAELDRQKQSIIDGLNREMTAKLTEIDVNSATSIAGINSAYHKEAMSHEQTMIAADKERDAAIAAARIKAQQEAKALNHGLTTSQIDKFMGYISKKDYSSAVRYLDIYGSSLDNSNLIFWMDMIPDNYINADPIVSQYGDVNSDGKYNVLDFIRFKKNAAKGG